MRWPALVLLLAACRSLPKSDYVPGGDGLPDGARHTYRRAVERERHGDLAGALKLLDELASSHPLRLGFHLRRIDVARRLHGRDRAAGLYDPPPPGVDPARASVLARLAQIPEEDVAGRKGALEAATAREPAEPFWRLGLADVELTSHDLVMRRAERERSLGRVGASEATRLEAGRLLENARQEAETALQYDPGFKEAHLILGYVATRRADLERKPDARDAWRETAMHHYEQALELDPACVTARLNLAENHLYFDQYTQAARQLRVAADLAPGEPLVWNNLGYTYYATGRVPQAIECYRASLDIDPGQARTRAALSDGLRRLGRTDEALDELRRARRDGEGDRTLEAEIAFKMAAIHEHEGDYRAAVEEYRTHIRLDGSDTAKAEWRIRTIFESAYER